VQLSADPATVQDILRAGADAIRPTAQKTVDDVKRAMGVG
jgi:hypothetical protein